MNIIFLDVDGVLNSTEYLKERFEELGRAARDIEILDPNCMKALKYIVYSR